MNRRCCDCDYFSQSHGACFEPSTWTQGEIGKIPGDPLILNQLGNCPMFERLPRVHATGRAGLWFRVRNFFRPIRIRIRRSK